MNAEHQTSNIELSTSNKPQFETVGDGLLVRAPPCCKTKVVTSRGQAGE
jgi:hypothetical protein